MKLLRSDPHRARARVPGAGLRGIGVPGLHRRPSWKGEDGGAWIGARSEGGPKGGGAHGKRRRYEAFEKKEYEQYTVNGCCLREYLYKTKCAWRATRASNPNFTVFVNCPHRAKHNLIIIDELGSGGPGSSK